MNFSLDGRKKRSKMRRVYRKGDEMSMKMRILMIMLGAVIGTASANSLPPTPEAPVPAQR